MTSQGTARMHGAANFGLERVCQGCTDGQARAPSSKFDCKKANRRESGERRG
jgi:hypothetical protein